MAQRQTAAQAPDRGWKPLPQAPRTVGAAYHPATRRPNPKPPGNPPHRAGAHKSHHPTRGGATTTHTHPKTHPRPNKTHNRVDKKKK
jgi:hypothetical protein